MRERKKRITGSQRFPVTKKAFTMVEILVATTILVIAMASIHMSFKGGVTSWTKGTARMEVYLNARASLDMMTREIGAAMLATSDLYAIDFVYSTSGSGGALRFAAIRDNSGDWDLTEIAYQYDSDGKEIERAIDAQYNFPDDKSPGDLSFQPLVSNITSLQFKFWNGTIWRTDWDSRIALTESGGIPATEDILPKEVKITITVQDEQNREEVQTFSTIVYLPTS